MIDDISMTTDGAVQGGDATTTALQIVNKYRLTGGPAVRLAKDIRDAILAERETCAQLKTGIDPDIEEPATAYGDGYVEGFWDCDARFRAAIRRRGTDL